MSQYKFNPFTQTFDIVIAGTEWTVFTPTIRSVNDSDDPKFADVHQKKGLYKVVGKSLHIIWEYSHTYDTGATKGNGFVMIGIPAGYTIDVAKLNTADESNGFARGTPVGHGGIMQDFHTGSVVVFAYNTTYLAIGANDPASVYYLIDNSFYTFDVNNYRLWFTAEIPIL